jgi:hypothetical protein
MIKRYLLKFIKGELSLKVTFWLWFVLFSFILEFFISSIFNINETLSAIYFIFIFVYTFAIFLAVFKSANRFQGSKVWSYLAKAIITINLFLSVSYFIELFQETYLEDYSITQEINFYKELIDINKKENTIQYVYKLYNTESFTALEKRKFIKQVQNSLCEEEGSQNILKKDYTLEYQYVDKNENNFLDIITDKSVCGESIYDLDILKEILRQRGEL